MVWCSAFRKPPVFHRRVLKMQLLLEETKQSWHIVITPFTFQHVVLIPTALKSPQAAVTRITEIYLWPRCCSTAQVFLHLLLIKMFQPELQMKWRIWVELFLVFLNPDPVEITGNSPRPGNKNQVRYSPWSIWGFKYLPSLRFNISLFTHMENQLLTDKPF